MTLSSKSYEVEKVVKAQVSHKNKRNITWKYLVKWKGYSAKQNTWEPIESFEESPTLIENFWKHADLGGRNQNKSNDFKVREEVVPRSSHEVMSDSDLDADGEEVDEEDEEATGDASAPLPAKEVKKRGRKRKLVPASPEISQPQKRKRGRPSKVKGQKMDDADRNVLTRRRGSRRSDNSPVSPKKHRSNSRRQRKNDKSVANQNESNNSEDEEITPSIPRRTERPLRRFRSLSRRTRRVVPENDDEKRDVESSHDGSLFSGDDDDFQNSDEQQEVRATTEELAWMGSDALKGASDNVNLTTEKVDMGVSDKDMNNTDIDKSTTTTNAPEQESVTNIRAPHKRSLLVELPTKSYNRPKKPRVQVFEDPNITQALATRVRGFKSTISRIIAKKSEPSSTSEPRRLTPARSPALDIPSPISAIERELLQKDTDVNSSSNTPTSSRALLASETNPIGFPLGFDTVSVEDLIRREDPKPSSANPQEESSPDPPTAAGLLSQVLSNCKDLPAFEDEETRDQNTDHTPNEPTEQSIINEPLEANTRAECSADLVPGPDTKVGNSEDTVLAEGALQKDALSLDASSWKQSTIFSPAVPPPGLSEKLASGSDKKGRQETKTFVSLYLSPSSSVPICFKDISSPLYGTSIKISDVYSSITSSPPGKLFTQQILDYVTVGGSSARVVPSESASNEEKALLLKLRDVLERGDLFVAAIGGQSLIFISSGNFDAASKLLIPKALTGLSGEIVAQNVVINDEIGYTNLVIDEARDLEL